MTTDEITEFALQADAYADAMDIGGKNHIGLRDEYFASLVRTAALEEAARVTGEFAQKWWSIHCASNKHMETTRKAHDDFCALQAAIRALDRRAHHRHHWRE